MKFNILLTSSGAVTSQGVVKGLRQQTEFKYKLVTTDIYDVNAGKHCGSAFYKVPLATSREYIRTLLAICKKEKINVLIPIHDTELLRVSQNAESFLNIGCFPLISSPETIKTCNNKYLTYQFFKMHGIPTPTTYKAGEIISGKVRMSYPIFVKPTFGIAAQGTAVIDNLNELKVWCGKIQKPLVQNLLKGKEFSIDTLADLKGKVIGVVPRTRDETKHGASVKGITVKDWELIRWAKFIAEKLKIIGPCNIQCFKSGKGKINFFEVNPRFSAAHAHTIAAGMNTPHLVLKMLAKQKVEPRIGQFKDGLRMIRYWAEVFESRDGRYVGESHL